jgi:beta-glucosidase
MSTHRIDTLLAEMTLAEKIGQLCQVQPAGRDQDDRVRAGGVGSLINVVGDDARHYQRLAVEESRLRIPLLLGRDVIHGFVTIFPIPLGQAASFDPAGVRNAAAIAARDAAVAGSW